MALGILCRDIRNMQMNILTKQSNHAEILNKCKITMICVHIF
jgi:hypothetical protein